MTPHQRFDPNTHYAIQQTHPPADTSHVKRKYLDIPYADLSPSQKLDVYLPDEGEGPFPVIVSIHGGAFMSCDKADEQVLPMLQGLKRGYAVVAANYRLSWEAIFPALVHDIKAAVRWIRANAQRYDLDPDRIAVWGGSAGGYLASMLGTSAGVPELEDLSLGNPEQPSHVQAVVAWFGPTDFLKMDEQLTERGLSPEPGMEHNGANSPESLLLGEQITKIPDRVKAANPETYVSPAAPPFFLQHGTMDGIVPVQMSIDFAEKLQHSLGKDRVQLELLEGAEHGDPQFETPDNVKKVLDFLGKHLKQESDPAEQKQRSTIGTSRLKKHVHQLALQELRETEYGQIPRWPRSCATGCPRMCTSSWSLSPSAVLARSPDSWAHWASESAGRVPQQHRCDSSEGRWHLPKLLYSLAFSLGEHHMDK